MHQYALCEHLKYATDDADRALVVNNTEYYFSEELKGNIR